jgi:hypothetical protein
MTATITRTWRERFAYRGPTIDADGIVVATFEVEKDSLENVRLMFQPGNRSCRPGTYHRIDVDGRLWMSDTDAEARDHLTPIIEADRAPGGRGLINGLGMGCVLGAWLDVLDHVDVVEIDPRVAEHIGGWYAAEYPGRVTVHVADAYTIAWPKGARWDVVWHDIWPSLCEDNLAEMGTLHRRYGRRAGWQGSWGKGLLEAERRRDRRSQVSWWTG